MRSNFPWESIPKYVLIGIVGVYSMVGAYSCAKARAEDHPSYASVVRRVADGETFVVYAGVTMPTASEVNAVRVDAIPGEPKGVYDCFCKDGTPRMVSRVSPTITAAPPVIVKPPVTITKPRRVVITGLYYDQYPDGHLVACPV